MKRKSDDYDTNLKRKKEDIQRTEKTMATTKEKFRELKAMATEYKDKPKPITFVIQKNAVKELRQSKKNWERKVEIAELEARQARAKLRKHQQMEMEGYNFDQ